MTQFSFLIEIVSKATILLMAAFVAAALLRRASAAARHFLWTAALAALLLLPAAVAFAPRWKLAAPAPVAGALAASAPAAQSAPGSATLVVHPRSARPSAPPWLWVWALGAAVVAARLAAGALATRRLVRRARAAEYPQPAAQDLARRLGIRRSVAILEAAGAPVPLACGIIRPAVVLPRGAAEWPETRLRTVLRHELEHIRRWDLAAHAVGRAACCLYWFHPLAWLAARRLRHERERACDDAVLSSGAAPHEYAADLVDLARGLAARHRAWPQAPAMAEASDLESRVRALFDASCNRRPVRIAAAATIASAMLALLLPLASVALYAQANRGVLAGIVTDPHGARIPNCRVTAVNLDGRNQEAAFTNAVGEYLIQPIPAGRYTLQVLVPGFARTSAEVEVAPGATSRLDVTMQLGAVQETMTVTGQRPPTVTPAPAAQPNAAPPRRIRVGGNVQPARLLSQVQPDYPPELQNAGIQGVVMIQGIIRTDGSVSPVEVTSTAVDARLVKLALDAAKQWHYQPSLLDGEPVETVTTLTIDFKLD